MIVLNKQSQYYRWHVITDLMPESGELRGAEVGVWKGECARHLLGMMPGLTLLMVDTWAPARAGDRYHQSRDSKAIASQAEHDAALSMAQEVAGNSEGRGIIRQGASVEVALSVDADSLDFVFIDADHTAEGVAEDIGAWIGKVKPGGIIAGHDIGRYGVEAGVKRMIGGAFHLSHDTTWWHRVRKGLR